ncbi:DNA-directed DNA polymerase [Purpureocillium takamizusanense]|uniref:DNA polymerase kappa n=1 Tax=Purpureocillium takamizusanense TaxID=2060973 RepID=A0A9Q8QQ18_9HYPO|nr:DNA-directed DNA polymerase [Purpureocillium takamizusanense]UNI23678.1 DNA-directed DNA polymerase [Purpureocillium takamizusanense]
MTRLGYDALTQRHCLSCRSPLTTSWSTHMAPPDDGNGSPSAREGESSLKTLKYHLLGPSLTKAGQEKVDQGKVSEVIYNASKGSKFFRREEERDKVLTKKIEQILQRKRELDNRELTHELRLADRLIAELEVARDLTQHVIHIDCDAFYAAVEQLERPELKDLPFAVGGGVLTTCNYVARQYGCRSGMAGFVAKKLCPELILIKPNFQKYTAKAHEIREILAEYDPRFESASVDEAYLNITEYCIEHSVEPAEAVEQMRREIHQKTSITVSAGIAANTKLAKICSNMNKPNGQYVLPNDRNAIMGFMRDLPTRKVNGIGRVLERELLEVGINTCGDLYGQRQYLNPLFGEKTFEFLLTCYLGLGRTKIQPAEDYERKSIGTEGTFGEVSDPHRLREKLRSIAQELEEDMSRAGCKGRTLCLKVKLHTFEVFTRQVVTPKAICLADDLYRFSLPMLAKLEQEMPGMKLRLMGLRCTHLVKTKKPDTMAFFGFRQRRTGLDGSSDPTDLKRKGVEASEEQDSWGYLEEDMGAGEAPDDPIVMAPDGAAEYDTLTSFAKHGKEIIPNPKKPKPDMGDEWWDCPICARPQVADERQFNEHIDLCLSRQTIRDAVQQDGSERPRSNTPEAKRPRLAEKNRGKSSAMDSKQMKLFFG